MSQMTEEEALKAYKDDTWLVWRNAGSVDRLVKLEHQHDDYEGYVWRLAHQKVPRLAHRASLRLATAKDLLELSDD